MMYTRFSVMIYTRFWCTPENPLSTTNTNNTATKLLYLLHHLEWTKMCMGPGMSSPRYRVQRNFCRIAESHLVLMNPTYFWPSKIHSWRDFGHASYKSPLNCMQFSWSYFVAIALAEGRTSNVQILDLRMAPYCYYPTAQWTQINRKFPAFEKIPSDWYLGDSSFIPLRSNLSQGFTKIQFD